MFDLMNFRELVEMLDNDERYKNEDYSIQKTHEKDKAVRIGNTPICYRDRYEYVGYATIWNCVGCIDYEFNMYKPVGNGTILYEKMYK